MKPRFRDHVEHVHAIIRAALAAVEPAGCVAGALRGHPARAGRPAVIAVGKAAAAMYRGYVAAAGEPAARFMLTVEGTGAPAWARIGDHPLPTERNVGHARALEAFLRDPAHEGFVVLLSGGASALLCSPVRGITLAELVDVSDALMRAGADIRELNTVRTHLETLKGGGAARLTQPRPVDLYVLSDVMGNDLSLVGSGPWWYGLSTCQDALGVLSRRAVGASEAVLAHLRVGARASEPRLGREANILSTVVAHNGQAVLAAREAAKSLGFERVAFAPDLRGEAGRVGEAIALDALARGPGCSISGGETTVNVGGKSGKGGRNQELALAAGIAIDGRPNIAVAAFATDGVDGPTDAAGAIVTGDTCRRAWELGIDPSASLDEHDSYGFFARVGGHLRTGPTGTNVNDLAMALVYAK